MSSTRDRLPIEAARLFAERGYHGTSIGDLADALGIRKASVYAHIKGKEELLSYIALAGAEAFHAALDEVPTDLPPGEWLRCALQAHLSVVRHQLDVATVWLQEWRYLTEPARGTFVAERRRYERRISTAFKEAVEAGTVRRDLDIRHAALMFLSVGNWAYTWMNHETDVNAEADALWSVLQRGIEQPKGRKT
jgi:AcrR family transcriptional regulator